MVPIKVSNDLKNLSLNDLVRKIEVKSYMICVTDNFENKKAVERTMRDYEMVYVEALNRIFDLELGFVPLQNKFYENVESLFGSDTAYNVNRTISSLRRIREIGFKYDEKFVKWFKNRIRFGSKKLVNKLEGLQNVENVLH